MVLELQGRFVYVYHSSIEVVLQFLSPSPCPLDQHGMCTYLILQKREQKVAKPSSNDSLNSKIHCPKNSSIMCSSSSIGIILVNDCENGDGRSR